LPAGKNLLKDKLSSSTEFSDKYNAGLERLSPRDARIKITFVSLTLSLTPVLVTVNLRWCHLIYSLSINFSLAPLMVALYLSQKQRMMSRRYN
jgi:hypothetical protein